MKIRTTFLSLCLALSGFMSQGQSANDIPMDLPPLFEDTIQFYATDILITVTMDATNYSDKERFEMQPNQNQSTAGMAIMHAKAAINTKDSDANRYTSGADFLENIAANSELALHPRHDETVEIWHIVFGSEMENFQSRWNEAFDAEKMKIYVYNRDTIPILLNGTTIYIVSDDVSNLENVEISASLTEIVQLSKAILKTSEEGNAEIDSLLKTGVIDAEEAEERREELNEELSDLVLELDNLASKSEGIELGDDLSEWAEAWRNQEDEDDWDWIEEDDDDDDFDFDDIWSDIKNRKKKATVQRTYWETDLFFGLNSLFNADGVRSGGFDELDLWGSNQFYLGFNGLTSIGNIDSRFKIRYGVGYYWHRFSFDRNTLFVQDAVEVQAVSGNSIGLDNSDFSYFRTRYIHVPVMLVIDNRHKGNRKNELVFGVGGYASLRTWSKMQYRGQDEIGNRITVENRGTYYVNDLRYGLQAQVGWGDFRVGVEYDLNPVFRDNRGPELYRGAITAGWSF